MLILHTIKETNCTVYIGSSGNKFIFNVAPINEPKPIGGYSDLKHICYMNGIELKDMEPIVRKAEEIMGRTIKENMAIEK